MRDAVLLAQIALDDFLWEIYSRPAGIFEQNPPSDAIVEGARHIFEQADNPKALSRFMAHFPRRKRREHLLLKAFFLKQQKFRQKDIR